MCLFQNIWITNYILLLSQALRETTCNQCTYSLSTICTVFYKYQNLQSLYVLLFHINKLVPFYCHTMGDIGLCLISLLLQPFQIQTLNYYAQYSNSPFENSVEKYYLNISQVYTEWVILTRTLKKHNTIVLNWLKMENYHYTMMINAPRK